MTTFTVKLNSPSKQIADEKGTTLEFRESQLKTFDSLDDAKTFCSSDQKNLKKYESLYIYKFEKQSNYKDASESVIFYMNMKSEGMIF